MITRRQISQLSLSSLLAATAMPARADEKYPSKLVKMIMPYPAGGGSDVLARVVAESLGQRLNQRTIVENITGAGGTIGTERAVRAEPDGYTLLFSTMNIVSINPALYKDLKFDTNTSLVPVSLLWETAHVIVVNPKLPYRTLQELIAADKAKPGAITYASGGVGTTTHLWAELFKHLTGTKFSHVPYRGNGPALADVIAGHVDIIVDQLANSADQIRAGKVRPLVVTMPARSPAFPDVLTAKEVALPDFEGSSWGGLSAPKGTPRPTIELLSKALREVLADPEVMKRMDAIGGTAKGSTPEEYGSLITSELAKWTEVIRVANISANP